MASSDSQINKPQRGCPKRAELSAVNINTGTQSINTERASKIQATVEYWIKITCTHWITTKLIVCLRLKVCIVKSLLMFLELFRIVRGMKNFQE